MNLMQIVTEIIFGTLTGYWTNDFAIKELFKKGGIVEKTRDEFTLEISALLEDRVLTEEILQEKLEAPEVQEAIKQLLEDFLSRDLPEHLANMTLENFDGMDELGQEIQRIAYGLWQKEKEQFNEYLQLGLANCEILSAPQRERLIEVGLEMITEELREGQYIAESLHSWSNLHQGQTWAQSEWEQFITQVIKNLGEKLVQGKNKWLEQEQIELEKELHNILERTDFTEVLSNFVENWSTKSLAEYYPNGAQEIKEQLLTYLNSEQGELVLNIISEKLLVSLYDVKLTLAELLPTEQIQQANPFLREQLEEILQLILMWLADNKYSLTKLVEDAVNDVFSAYEGMQGVVLHYVKENFITELIYNYDFTGQLQEQTKKQQTAQELLQQLEKYLLHQPLGEVLQRILPIEQGKVLILPMLKENLNFYLENYAENHLKQLANYPIKHWLGDYFSRTKVEQIVVSLEKQVVNYLLKLDVTQLSSQLREYLLQQKITTTLTENRIELIQDLLTDNIGLLKNYINDMLKLLTNEKILHLLGQVLTNWLSKQDNLLEGIQTKPLQPLYQHLLTQETADFLVQKGQTVLLENFVPMSRGSLSMLAKERLDLLSNEEMRLLVQEFMGSKLKILNYLGAGMGSVVGLATGVGLSQVGGAYLFGKTFIFGALGYGTNCAAIKGLFWPYQPIAGQEWLQGIIPRQKKSFAHFMGQMVNDYVVNEEIFQQIVRDYRSEAVKQIMLLSENSEFNASLQQKVNYALAKTYPSTEEILKQKALNSCSDWGEKPLDTLYFPALQNIGVRYYPVVSQKIYAKTREFLRSDTLIPAHKLWPYAEEKIVNAQVPEVKNYWQQFWRKEYKIGDFCSPEVLEVFLNKGEELCRQKILAEATCCQIAEYSNQVLQEERLGTAFQGQLTIWLEHNIQKMLTYFLQKITVLFEAKQEVLTKLIQESIINNLTLFQQLGYTMINGNKLVGEVVEKLITEKLPVFLNLKQQEIAYVVMDYWRHNLAQVSLKDLKIVVKPQMVQTLFTHILQQKPVQEGKEELLNLLKGDIPKLALSPIVNQLQLEQEIREVQVWLDKTWQAERKEVGEWLEKHFAPYLIDTLGQVKLQDIFSTWADNCFTPTWFEKELKQFNVEPLAMNFYQNMLIKIGKKTPQELVKWSSLVETIDLVISYFLNDKEAREWLLSTIKSLVKAIYEKLPPSLKEQVVELVVAAVFTSLQRDGSAILCEMNLASLTEEQVLAMEAQELEEMVWRFGRQYLVHIQNMGWLGAVFALPGILLSLLM